MSRPLLDLAREQEAFMMDYLRQYDHARFEETREHLLREAATRAAIATALRAMDAEQGVEP